MTVRLLSDAVPRALADQMVECGDWALQRALNRDPVGWPSVNPVEWHGVPSPVVDEIGHDLRAQRWTAKHGWVYAVDGAGLTKFGFSAGLRARIASLMTMSPVPIRFLGAVPTLKRCERSIHKACERSRSHGEWFRPEPPVPLFRDALIAGWERLKGAYGAVSQS